MTILGIDPGLERIGYGVVARNGSQLTAIDYGVIVTPRFSLPERLVLAQDEITRILEKHKPDAVATERLLFTVNKTTAMDVAKALGAVLSIIGRQGLDWSEYSPPEVKQTVVGNGNADKKQVQFMVTKLLGLKETPKPDDIADALAIAITHALKSRVNLTRT